MAHPNESFLRKFLGTEKEYLAKQKALKKRQDALDFIDNNKNRQNTLLEDNKKAINISINKIYQNTKKQNLQEQSYNSKDWKLVTTPQGIFYHNKKENLWMNNFGVIKPSLEDFISLFDYGIFDTSDKKETVEPPQAPSELQVQMSVSGVTLGWQDNSENESGFNIYFRRELA